MECLPCKKCRWQKGFRGLTDPGYLATFDKSLHSPTCDSQMMEGAPRVVRPYIHKPAAELRRATSMRPSNETLLIVSGLIVCPDERFAEWQMRTELGWETLS